MPCMSHSPRREASAHFTNGIKRLKRWCNPTILMHLGFVMLSVEQGPPNIRACALIAFFASCFLWQGLWRELLRSTFLLLTPTPMILDLEVQIWFLNHSNLAQAISSPVPDVIPGRTRKSRWADALCCYGCWTAQCHNLKQPTSRPARVHLGWGTLQDYSQKEQESLSKLTNEITTVVIHWNQVVFISRVVLAIEICCINCQACISRKIQKTA